MMAMQVLPSMQPPMALRQTALRQCQQLHSAQGAKAERYFALCGMCSMLALMVWVAFLSWIMPRPVCCAVRSLPDLAPAAAPPGAAASGKRSKKAEMGRSGSGRRRRRDRLQASGSSKRGMNDLLMEGTIEEGEEEGDEFEGGGGGPVGQLAAGAQEGGCILRCAAAPPPHCSAACQPAALQ